MNRIREYRKKKKLTLKQLSEELAKQGFKISADALGKYERGDREPKLETWIKLADFFDVSVSYLQGIIDDPVDFAHDYKMRDNFYNTQKFVEFIKRINKINDDNDNNEENFDINDYDEETKRVIGIFLGDVDNLVQLIMSFELTSKEAKVSRIKLFNSMDAILQTINNNIGLSLLKNRKLSNSDLSELLKDNYSNMALKIHFLLSLIKNKTFSNMVQELMNKELNQLKRKGKETRKR